jgi:hypothetical protein
MSHDYGDLFLGKRVGSIPLMQPVESKKCVGLKSQSILSKYHPSKANLSQIDTKPSDNE